MSGELPKNVGRLQSAARVLLSPFLHTLWDLKVYGAENLPDDGAAILCANHTSVLDSFFMPGVLPRRITFVGKAEYLDDWKTKHLFPMLGMIPIDRSGGDAAAAALDCAASILDSGQFFGIYPEGTRSRDGRLHKGHTGPARLALRTGAPIIPVGLRGMRDVQPPEASFPKFFKTVEIYFGEPIEASRYDQHSDRRLLLRQMIDEVMFEIKTFTGQEYVHEYANKKKADVAQPTPEVDPVAADGRSSADVLKPVPLAV
ncbi:MAG: lysophospholipid acyltransferase family protein [Acidimicrobiales bacterium]